MVSLLFLITYFSDIAFTLTSIILGYLFINKYQETKKIEVLNFGLAVIVGGITLTGYSLIGDTIVNFINDDYPFLVHYFVFGLFPLAAIFYIKSISTLVIKERINQKRVMILVIIISLILILCYYILFFIDTNFIGEIAEEGNYVASLFVDAIFSAITSLIILIGSLVFVYKALKTNEELSQLKGKIILVASIFLLVSALSGLVTKFLGIPAEIDSIINVTTRVLGFIFLYLGFILPEPLRKLFLK
jgi:hypothetical protein